MDTSNNPLAPADNPGATPAECEPPHISLFQHSLCQIQSLRQSRRVDGGLGGQGGPANMPQITGLDVTCEKTGMMVSLQFSAPFNGVVFSKGHFSNPACR